MAKAIKGHYKANTKQRCPMLNIDHKKGYVQGWLSVTHNLRVTERRRDIGVPKKGVARGIHKLGIPQSYLNKLVTKQQFCD